MSEKLPFEENMEQQFNKLQLPDEEQSWQKMKALLDEDDRKPRPVFFLLSCLGWGLLFLGLSAGAYFLFFNDPTADNPTSKINTETSTQDQINKKDEIKSSNKSDLVTGQSHPNNSFEPAKQEPGNLGQASSADANHNNFSSEARSGRKDQKPTLSNANKTRSINVKNKPLDKIEGVIENGSSKNTKGRIEKPGKEAADNDVKTETDASVNAKPKNTAPDQAEPGKDSTARSGKPKATPVTPAVDSAINKKQAVKKLYFSAGLGIQQQVPIGGQESVPYDAYGRKVSISDYIPSAFLRLHKEDKWFIMGEFRYGAPQQVNDFNYEQHSVYDTSSMTLATTTMRLKKTYYHQLPISFNYYVKPGWSVGLGAMYSRFYGAVTEKEVKNYNVYTQDISYSKSINNVRGFTDSFLHKTQVHFIVNTDYQYKNFLLGLRFTKDIQPYIKYTTPDGIKNEEKNYSLQVILRWQIWKSRK